MVWGLFLAAGAPGAAGGGARRPKMLQKDPPGSPKWGPRSDQERPKKPQDGPGSRQEAKMGPRSALRTAQGGSRRL